MTELELWLRKITNDLKREKIPYMVVGGLAANYYGIPRPTYDIDIVVVLQQDKVKRFVKDLKKLGFEVYKDDVQQMLKIANRVMLRGYKIPFRVDFWWPKTEFEKEAFRRRRRYKINDNCIWLGSPEDIILMKLLSYRPRDQEDIIGIIELHRKRIDWKYLWDKAKVLNRHKDLKRLLKE